MSEWNQKQGQEQKNPGQGSQGQGPKTPGQGHHGKTQNSTHGQGATGAWVWLRWSEDAPENAWEQTGNTNYESWHCNSGQWNCKIWVPAQSENEAKQFVETKLKNNKWVQETKTEWNWNQSAAA